MFRRLSFGLIAALVLGVVACEEGAPADATATPAETPTEEVATAAPTSEAATASATPDDLEDQLDLENLLNVEILTAGDFPNNGQAEGVDFQRFDLSLSFVEQLPDGSESTGEILASGVQENTAPIALQMEATITGLNPSGVPQHFSFVRIGNVEFIAFADGSCTSNVLDESRSPFSDLVDSMSFVGRLPDASLVEQDIEVNGVRANQYHVDGTEADLGPTFGSTTAFGVDLDRSLLDGAIVRAIVASTASGGVFKEANAAESTVDGEFNYSEFNEPQLASPPEACATAAEVDAPLLEGAQNVRVFDGGTITYSLDLDLELAALMYRDAMAEDGWTHEGSSTVPDTFARQRYTADGRSLTISLLSLGGFGTAVRITEEPSN